MRCLLRRGGALGLVVALAPPSATAADLLACDFTGTSPGVNTPWTSTSLLAAGVDYSGWTRGSGVAGRSDIHDAFGFQVSAGAAESTLEDAFARNDYIGFTVTPATATSLNLNRLEVEFGIRRGSWHAPRQYSLYSSVAGFTSGAALFTTSLLDNADETSRTFRFFLPASGYDNLAAPVEFRLYAYGARYHGHPTRLTQFSILDFAGSAYSLFLSSGPGGTISANPSTSPLREGEVVLVSAVPDVGYRFSGWSGSYSGKGNPLTVIMNADTTVTALFELRPAPRMQVGTNLSPIASWGTQQPFVDLFRRSTDWWTRNADGSGGWESGLSSEIPRRRDGYSTHVPFVPPSGVPQIVHTNVTNFPTTGTASLLYEGSGRMRSDRGNGTSTWHTATGGSGRFDFPVSRQQSSFFLEIHESYTTDPIRNLRLIAPGFQDTWQSSPFEPVFLDRLRPFSMLRYMDWGATNASPLERWDDRTLPESNTWDRANGAALEVMADLSNTLQQDAWICIPHRADDEYVSRTARLLRDRLDPDLRLYVEYSNETWNSAYPFPQTTYVQDRGEALGLSDTRWTAGQYYAALRSAQVWKIFEEEFGPGGASRLVRVLAAQSGDLMIAQLRFEALNNPSLNPDRLMPDALAIAPYFGLVYTPAQIAAEGYPTVEDLMTTVSQHELLSVSSQVEAHRRLADLQGCPLICYEGGQHYVGILDAENDTTLTEILIAANRDPRMGGLYTQYLDLLRDGGVELFANFSYVAEPSKWGSWGVLEYQDQPISEAPKYRALTDWLAAQTASCVEDWALY